MRGEKMPAVKGKTGNPGVKNPKKRSSTTFAVKGAEPKGRMMGFRPTQSLEGKIDEAVATSGMKLADWLVQAALAYLEKSPESAGQQLEQGQLSSNTSAPEEPAAATGDETPASGRLNAEGQEQQALDTQTSSKSKTRPGARAKTRKATRG